MQVNVSFTLDVDPAEWLGRPYFGERPTTAGPVDETVVESEVREHARLVVTDLYRDQGWLVEPNVSPLYNY